MKNKKRKGETKKPSREQLEAAGLGANVSPLPGDREWRCPGCGWKFTTAHCPDCGIDREWVEAEEARNAEDVKASAGAMIRGEITDDNANVDRVTARLMDDKDRTFASMFPGSERAKICDELGANVYGRISCAVSQIDERRFTGAGEELRAVIAFLEKRPDSVFPYWDTGEPDMPSEPQYRLVDDMRAARALITLSACAEGNANAAIFDTATAAEIVVMMRSQARLARIAKLSAVLECLDEILPGPHDAAVVEGAIGMEVCSRLGLFEKEKQVPAWVRDVVHFEIARRFH